MTHSSPAVHRTSGVALALALLAGALPAQGSGGRGGAVPPAAKNAPAVVAKFDTAVAAWLKSDSANNDEYQRLTRASAEAAHELAGLGEAGEDAVKRVLSRFSDRDESLGGAQQAQKLLRALLFYAEKRSDLGVRPLGAEVIDVARRFTTNDNYQLRGQGFILLASVDGPHLPDTSEQVTSKINQIAGRLMAKELGEQLRDKGSKGQPVMSADFSELAYFASAAACLARNGEMKAYRALLRLLPDEKLDQTIRLGLVGALGETAGASPGASIAIQAALLESLADKRVKGSDLIFRAVAEQLQANTAALIAFYGEKKTLPTNLRAELTKTLRETERVAAGETRLRDLERQLKRGMR